MYVKERIWPIVETMSMKLRQTVSKGINNKRVRQRTGVSSNSQSTTWPGNC